METTNGQAVKGATWLVPMTLPLLLFSADFRQIALATGKLMDSFHL